MITMIRPILILFSLRSICEEFKNWNNIGPNIYFQWVGYYKQPILTIQVSRTIVYEYAII